MISLVFGFTGFNLITGSDRSIKTGPLNCLDLECDLNNLLLTSDPSRAL